MKAALVYNGGDLMQKMDYFEFLVKEIHSVIAATVDDEGRPVTCAIDIMDFDKDGLYFLTAKGKNFYDRLKKREFISLTGMKGEDTMSRVALSIGGKVRKIGAERLPILFEKNPYMHEIYPTDESVRALTVFCIYEGSGEWFDLSKKPIQRDSFVFGKAEKHKSGYFVTSDCIGCGACTEVCPQNCIDIADGRAEIHHENCLHCGNCISVCPVGAVKRS